MRGHQEGWSIRRGKLRVCDCVVGGEGEEIWVSGDEGVRSEGEGMRSEREREQGVREER